MRRAGLVPRGRHSPQLGLKVEFWPPRPGRLVAALAGQRQEPEHRSKGVSQAAGRVPERAYLVVCQRLLARLEGADQRLWLQPGARIVLDTVDAGSDHPFEQRADIG